jgi:hypothetical protein
MKKQLTLGFLCCLVLGAAIVGYRLYSEFNFDVVAVGDIAYQGGRHDRTAALASSLDPDIVLVLGDTVYEEGTTAQYAELYNPTWGQFLPITLASPGNHEYKTPNASGYFSYFGEHAGPDNRGYYSVDRGTWHIISLNSEKINNAQLEWLDADLNATDKKCILAFWHKPLFSSGEKHGNTEAVKPFWNTLYAHGADLVLNGHEHVYERFTKQDPAGKTDPNGIRQFTVGTGGGEIHDFRTIQPHSEAHASEQYGVLHLKLTYGGYTAEFVPAAESTYTDTVAQTLCN